MALLKQMQELLKKYSHTYIKLVNKNGSEDSAWAVAADDTSYQRLRDRSRGVARVHLYQDAKNDWASKKWGDLVIVQVRPGNTHRGYLDDQKVNLKGDATMNITKTKKDFASYGAKVVTSIDLEVEVRKVLEDFTNNDATFSAYDVTRHLRSEFDNININHAKVKQFVHSIMPSYSDYETFDKPYGQTGVLAITYRPKVTNAAAVSTKPLKLVSQKPNTYVYPKSEGRVTVPSNFLKEIGITPYDYVTVTKNNNLLVVSKWTPSSGTNGGPLYSTDRSGSVRLRKNIVAGWGKFGVVVTKDSVQLVGE